MKAIGLVIFVLGVVAASYVAVNNTHSNSGFNEQSFKSLWVEDIQQLEKSGKLPAAWSDLSNVEITVTSPTLKPWLDRYSPDFGIKPSGKFKLLIFLDDFQDNGNTGILIQYSLIDLHSKDTIWELGRTLIL